jgi:hypothetical protein
MSISYSLPKSEWRKIDAANAPVFTKYQLADQMRNYMHIDDKYLEGLSVYTIHHISGKEFKSRLLDGQIYSYIDPKPFNVIYHNCSPYNAKRAVEVRCSFRMAHDNTLEPIVLVEIVIPFTTPE